MSDAIVDQLVQARLREIALTPRGPRRGSLEIIREVHRLERDRG